MSAKPRSLDEPIRVEMANGSIRAESPAQGSPRWAYLEGQRVAERIIAGMDMAPRFENKAELALHTFVMMRAEELRHPAVSYDVMVNWRGGVTTAVDEAWKAAQGGTR